MTQTEGEEAFLIPALLAHRDDRDIWLYGREAVAASGQESVTAVGGLLSLAVAGEPVSIAGRTYDPVALLSLFLKRSLNLLTPVLNPEKAQAFVFSVDEVTKPVVDALAGAYSLLGLSAQMGVVGREESFFYYNICQPQELWRGEVLLCDFYENRLRTFLFSVNRRSNPATAFVDRRDFPEVVLPEEDHPENINPKAVQSGETPDPPGSEAYARELERLDLQFAQSAEDLLAGHGVKMVYLVGEGFRREWYRESLRLLCRDRRVFRGNNLYSKGACYAALERLDPGSLTDRCVFVGRDMVRANIGIYALRRGREVYLPLLDARVNWYEAKGECDFLLEEENTFSLKIVTLDGNVNREARVTLDGLPARPRRASRIHLEMDMTDGETVRIRMEDLGFGEFFPATHRLWEESFQI